eukprot:UN04581
MANADLPISVIIVGIGDADFGAMRELDGDDKGLMNSKGTYAKRDVVQFVRMNSYKSLYQLSKQTLMEIPRQFLSYTKAHNIEAVEKMKIQQNANLFGVSEDDLKQNEEAEYELQAQDSNYNQAVDMYADAPLPFGWERGFDENDRPYYVDNVNQKTQWEHPSSIKTQ